MVMGKELSHGSQRVFSGVGCRIGLKKGAQLGTNGKWSMGVMRQHLHSLLKKLTFSSFSSEPCRFQGGRFH